MIDYMIFKSMHPVKSGIGPLNELLSSHLQPKDIWIMMLQGSSILVELIMETNYHPPEKWKCGTKLTTQLNRSTLQSLKGYSLSSSFQTKYCQAPGTESN